MGRRGRQPIPFEIRFWRHVDKRGPDECWNWTGSSYTHITTKEPTYGQTSYNGVRMGAHRASWIHHNQVEVPEDMDVMHTCDNPKCVNPKHLKLGTTAENMHDREIKGRAKNKLKRWQVEEIKTLLAAGCSQAFIADKYNVTQGAISHINVGITWGMGKTFLRHIARETVAAAIRRRLLVLIPMIVSYFVREKCNRSLWKFH